MMSTVTELYMSLYEKLCSFQNNYQQAQSRISITMEQDEATRKVRIENLEEQLQKIDEYSEKLEYFRHLAEKHLVSKNLLSIEPRELNFNRLRNWAMQIDPTEADDPYAQRIYVLVKSNEHFLSLKKAEFEQKLEELQSQEVSGSAMEARVIKELRIRLLSETVALLESEEFSDFSKLLISQHRSSSNIASELMIETEPASCVSIGGYAKAFPVFDELRYIVKEKLGEYYDAKNSSVLLPVEHALDSDMFLAIGCAASKSKKLYRGLQNYLLNLLSRSPIGSRRVCLLDALHFNNSILGNLKSLEETAMILSVPKDSEQILDSLKQLVSDFPDIDDTLGLADSVVEYNRTVEENLQLTRTVLILVGYPSAFSTESKDLIRRILFNYEHYGITPILIDDHYVPKDEDSMPDVPVDIADHFYRIRMTQSKELISQNNGAVHHFRWYELRDELDPQYVAKIQSASKEKSVLGTEYIKRIDLVSAKPYDRGKKSIVLPYGVDSKDEVHCISFDNENFASFLMGASGSGKSTLLHTLITGIIRNYHPDDVELWLADFKMSEFAQYINPMPPHIKYILLDESRELVFDLIDRLTEKMMERQRFFVKHRDMKKVENVPVDIYMPVIFVMLDEFSIMSQQIEEAPEYKLKLQNLLAKGRALGIKFLFSSQSFLNGIRGLTPTAKAQIQSRIAMKNNRDEITATMELSSSQKTDQVRNWVEALPPHYALYKYREGDTVNIKRLQVMYFKGTGDAAYEPQRNMIEGIRNRMRPVAESAYDVNYTERYVDKHPLVVDGNSFAAFNPQEMKARFEAYRKNPDNNVAEDDVVAAFGSPRRMSHVKLTALSTETRENILLIARNYEQSCAMAILMSAITSFRLQKRDVQIWTYSKNRLYRTYGQSLWKSHRVVVDNDDICDAIRELKEQITQRKCSNQLIVMVGMERICADFDFADGMSPARTPPHTTTAAERRIAEEELLRKKGALAESEAERANVARGQAWLKRRIEIKENAKREGKTPAEIKDLINAEKEIFFSTWSASNPVPPPAPTVETDEVPPEEPMNSDHVPVSGAYNAKEDLKYIVKYGSRYGYHFMMCLNTLSDLSQTALKLDLFRYRMAFQVSEDDSRALFGNKHANALPEHICQYHDSLERYSFRPYLHPGITWDGWYVAEDSGIAYNAFEL